MTILDNLLNVGEKAGEEEQADGLHPHPGGLLEGTKGGCKKWHRGGLLWGALVVMKVLREVR
jgi:hypothetical protein